MIVDQQMANDLYARYRVRIQAGSEIIGCDNISIGYSTNFNGKIIIKGSMPCSIGKYCAIGYDLTIITDDHDMKRANLQYELMARIGFSFNFTSKGNVIIGNNVWIGDRVTILSGVNIGDGSVVGAGSVVTKSVLPFSIVAGSPAKLVKKRFSDNIITQLKNIKWWDWPEDKMRVNKAFFQTDLTVDPALDLYSIIIP